MHKPEVWKLVINRLLPNKTDASPSDWRSYVYRYLVPEIQQETLRFYGPLDCVEPLHPGLDYTNPNHRHRLSMFPRHQQLFSIFEDLRLSPNEIGALCKWDGTKRERESYERRTKNHITDTTWVGVHPYSKPKPTAIVNPPSDSTGQDPAGTINTGSVMPTPITAQQAAHPSYKLTCDVEIVEPSSEESEDEVEVQHSVGISLNQRLLAATEARARGEDVPLDADWEQWMKEALERDAMQQAELPHGARRYVWGGGYSHPPPVDPRLLRMNPPSSIRSGPTASPAPPPNAYWTPRGNIIPPVTLPNTYVPNHISLNGPYNPVPRNSGPQNPYLPMPNVAAGLGQDSPSAATGITANTASVEAGMQTGATSATSDRDMNISAAVMSVADHMRHSSNEELAQFMRARMAPDQASRERMRGFQTTAPRPVPFQ